VSARPAAAPPALVSTPAAPRTTSKVLPRFLAALSPAPAPVIMDLGPVVGQNISFFGEQLACKILVLDLMAEVESHARRADVDGLGAALTSRIQVPDGAVDGILCWNLFDFLDRPVGQQLAARLVRLLKSGGVLYGFFGMTAGNLSAHTRFLVDGADAYHLRTAPATPTRRTVLAPRDINKMFEGLTVAESVLLKSNTREALFRKP
jgi:hypothetical protein